MDYQALITKRRSIRNFELTSFTADEMQVVINILQQLQPLNDCKHRMKIVTHQEFWDLTGGLFRIEAPHYILFYGDGTIDGLVNIGFLSEQICLLCALNNLGTVFLGGATIKDKKEKSTYALSLAFGKPLEPFRVDRQAAKRKTIEEIATGNIERFREVLDDVRLAPSAMNHQPWYFVCHEQEIDVYLNRPPLLPNLRKMQKIDIGIALSHFLGHQPHFLKKENKKLKHKKYIMTVLFK